MSLDHLVARQAGVVALHQAVGCGVSAATVHRRTREGSWRRLHPSVYLVGGHRLTDEARVRAAWLWAGDGAALTGAAAAYWHGLLPRAPEEIEVTLPRRVGQRPQPSLRVRRRDLYAADLMRTRDVWLTGVPLLDPLQTRARFPTVYQAYCRNMGRHGSSAAGRLLVAAADRADSAAERLLVRILREGGVTGWVLGFPFGPWRIDLAFPAQKVAVEVDGWAWHVDPELSQPPDATTSPRAPDVCRVASDGRAPRRPPQAERPCPGNLISASSTSAAPAQLRSTNRRSSRAGAGLRPR